MTGRYEGPRLADPGEFPELLALVDRCFNHESGGMRASNPHCYDPDRPEDHAVVTRDGRVVAHAAVVRDTLVCGPATVACPGLSGVATDPRHTGEGLMSALVEFWLDRLTDAPLSRLWGDRARYGRFGFETVGREREYRITGRSFPDPPDRDAHVTHCDGTLGAIPGLHARLPFRVARTETDHRTLFDQRGLEVLRYEDGATRAYLAVRSNRRERTVTEVAGDPEGVEGLLAYLFRAYYTDEVRVRVHPGDPVAGTVRPLSVDWVDHTHKQVRVGDLPGTLDALAPLVARRLPADATGAVTLDADDAGRARLRWDGDDVSVSRTERPPDVELDRREAARLLFDGGHGGDEGTNGPGGALPRSLRESVLPLPFFVPRTEWV